MSFNDEELIKYYIVDYLIKFFNMYNISYTRQIDKIKYKNNHNKFGDVISNEIVYKESYFHHNFLLNNIQILTNNNWKYKFENNKYLIKFVDSDKIYIILHKKEINIYKKYIKTIKNILLKSFAKLFIKKDILKLCDLLQYNDVVSHIISYVEMQKF